MDKKTVACVLRSGGDYTAEHVKLLRRGVRAMSDAAFVCLTDADIKGVRTIPLVTDWPGWLAKLELFRPGLFNGPVLYLDLDTTIAGPLDQFFTGDGDFRMIRDFYHPEKPASGVMAWSGDHSEIFNSFSADKIPEYVGFAPNGGDCGWIRQHVSPVLIPDDGEIVSYKRDIAARGMPGWHATRSRGNGKVPRNAKLICFHGRPHPWQVGFLEGDD